MNDLFDHNLCASDLAGLKLWQYALQSPINGFCTGFMEVYRLKRAVGGKMSNIDFLDFYIFAYSLFVLINLFYPRIQTIGMIMKR